MKEYHSIFDNYVIIILSLRGFMANKFNLTHSFGARKRARKSSECEYGRCCERGIRKRQKIGEMIEEKE